MLKSILAYIDSIFTPRAASAEAVDYAVRETFDKLCGYPVLQLGFEDNELMVARLKELHATKMRIELSATMKVKPPLGSHVHVVVGGWQWKDRSKAFKVASHACDIGYDMHVYTEHVEEFMERFTNPWGFAIIVANWTDKLNAVHKLNQSYIDHFQRLTRSGGILVISKHLLPPLEELKFDGFERLDDKGDFVLFRRLPSAHSA